jgi:HD-GYP domain-containing protein (c-di-GMP phosphodiesterase class II)
MRLVRVNSVRDEMELARDIPSPALGAQPLLRRGVRLSEALAARLASLNVRAIWVEDDLGDGIRPVEVLPEHVRRSTEVAVAKCLEKARAVAADLTSLPAAVLGALEQAAAAIMEALADSPEAALAFDDLASADSYTYSHSVRVATLGVLLGQRIDRVDGWVDWRGDRHFERKSDRLTQLAMGLLIHDIGKISIPETVLNKPGKLTPEEWDLVKTHPAAGASMLSVDRVPQATIAIVRDHHERWDGLGYARGRRGEEIHQFARIAAVADVYDAITADRPYKPGRPPHVGVSTISEGAGTQFDGYIVEHFKHVAMPYPVGYTITLPDGRPGAVVGVSPAEPEYPVVRFRDASGTLDEAAMNVVDGEVLAGYGTPITADVRQAA